MLTFWLTLRQNSSSMAKRKVIFYKSYFQDFFSKLDTKTRKTVLQVLAWIQSLDIIPVSMMKSIAGVKGLYEIRIEYNSNISYILLF